MTEIEETVEKVEKVVGKEVVEGVVEGVVAEELITTFPNSKFQNKDKRRLEDIDLDKITISEANVRKLEVETETDILAKSLVSHGLLQPIEVRQKGSFYEAIQGQRRIIAARRVGWKKIRAWVLGEDIDEKDDSIRSFEENVNRLNLDPRDKARFVLVELERYNGDWISLSEKLNRSVSQLQKWAEYKDIPGKIQEMVAEKKIGQGYARDISKYSEVDTDELVKIAGKVAEAKTKEEKDRILGYIKRNPRAKVKDIDEKINEEVGLAITISFSSRISKAIRDEAAKRDEEPHQYIKSIIREHLEVKGLLKE